MNEGGGLKCLARPFVCQLLRGEFAQFVVDQRKQLPSRVRVAGCGRAEELGDVGHAAKITART